jgi:carboxylate-amine ligase
MDGTYRFGIEEEYFLADATTRGTPRRGVAGFHKAARARLKVAEREIMESQVEVSTPPLTSFAEARATLAGLRAGLAETGRAHGIKVFASGTHPIARWSRQSHTKKERYAKLIEQLQIIGRRTIVCGMHVHVEVPRPETRVDLMNRLLPTMPLLLALSVSSPFWQGQQTGMAGYRMSAFGEMPRTGLPLQFNGAEDYERYVDVMTRVGAISDASFLWWTLRPSVRYPTLELRVADSCTSLDHTIAIAALYRCLVRYADRQPKWNRDLSGAEQGLAAENIWRAQRDGARAELIDAASGSASPLTEHLDAMLQMVAEDAEILGCSKELQMTRAISRSGTSSDRQIAIFAAARERGLGQNDAGAAVVDWLATTTEEA